MNSYGKLTIIGAILCLSIALYEAGAFPGRSAIQEYNKQKESKMVVLGSGNYLKTADVNNGDRITILAEGDWVESTMYKYDDGNPKVDFITKVDFKGTEVSVRINKTNRTTLQEAYGDDTAAWVGKQAILTKEKCMVGGKKMDTLVYEIPEGQEAVGSVNVEEETFPD